MLTCLTFFNILTFIFKISVNISATLSQKWCLISTPEEKCNHENQIGVEMFRSFYFVSGVEMFCSYYFVSGLEMIRSYYFVSNMEMFRSYYFVSGVEMFHSYCS